MLCTGSGRRASTSGPELFAVKGPPYAQRKRGEKAERRRNPRCGGRDLPGRGDQFEHCREHGRRSQATRRRIARAARHGPRCSEQSGPIRGELADHDQGYSSASRSTDGRLERRQAVVAVRRNACANAMNVSASAERSDPGANPDTSMLSSSSAWRMNSRHSLALQNPINPLDASTVEPRTVEQNDLRVREQHRPAVADLSAGFARAPRETRTLTCPVPTRGLRQTYHRRGRGPIVSVPRPRGDWNGPGLGRRLGGLLLLPPLRRAPARAPATGDLDVYTRTILPSGSAATSSTMRSSAPSAPRCRAYRHRRLWRALPLCPMTAKPSNTIIHSPPQPRAAGKARR